jgi:TonB family protein
LRLALVPSLAMMLWAAPLRAQPADQASSDTPGETDVERAPQVTRPPKLVHFVEAEYPADKKAAGVTASVLLTVEIGADGKVGNVGVAQSAGADFDAAAVAAAKQFVFEPAEVDGKPAPVKIDYRYQFAIKTQIVKLGPQVNFEGIVLERYTKKPMAGVSVAVKDTGATAVTDDAGHFAFIDVPLGVHKVELAAPKLVTVATEEELVKDQKKTVKYFVRLREEGIDEETVVRASRIKKESVQTVIRTEEARRVPGTQGDTLKVVQNLPGVARSALGSGALIVWGSAPADTRVNVDGVEIPALYHVGGLRSTVNGDLVRSIDLLPGGYGADYGRGLGGLVKVETRALPQKGVHGYVAADVLDTSAMVTATLSPSVRLAVAGRYSYLDRILAAVTTQDIGDYFPIPRYDDYQGILSIRLGRDENVDVVFLASDDHLRRSIPSSDPAEVRSENDDSSLYRGFVRYTKLNADGSSFVITPSVGYDTSSSITKFGATPTTSDSTAWRYGLRSAYRRRFAKFATLSVGVDMLGTMTHSTRSGSLDIPPREGDIFVFGRPPGDDVNADDWHNHILDVGPYVFAELNAGKFSFVPGLRIDGYMIEGSAIKPAVLGITNIGFSRLDWGVDPRFSVNARLHKRFTMTASAGLYHQAPEPTDLSAVFGNPQLNLSSALHVSLGAALKLTGTLSLELVGFYKQLWDLPSRNEAPTPPLAEALVQEGIGRSYGGQLLLRQELFKGFFGWITYSLSRSERQDHPDRNWRLFDFDQTHVLGVVASYEWRGFIAGVRFRWTTGMPRTPVVGAFYDARGDQFQPLFGAQNSIRIPDFVQLDVRVEKTFTFRRGLSLNVFADIQNVTNRSNPEELVYNYNFTQRDYITGLPILSVIGVRLQW